jgi:hypothetical protein
MLQATSQPSERHSRQESSYLLFRLAVFMEAVNGLESGQRTGLARTRFLATPQATALIYPSYIRQYRRATCSRAVHLEMYFFHAENPGDLETWRHAFNLGLGFLFAKRTNQERHRNSVATKRNNGESNGKLRIEIHWGASNTRASFFCSC